MVLSHLWAEALAADGARSLITAALDVAISKLQVLVVLFLFLLVL